MRYEIFKEELTGKCAAFEGLEAVECLKGIKHSDLSQVSHLIITSSASHLKAT